MFRLFVVEAEVLVGGCFDSVRIAEDRGWVTHAHGFLVRFPPRTEDLILAAPRRAAGILFVDPV